jgi:hypothetical protein
MEKKEFKAGEIFQCGLLKLKCEKSSFSCKGCYFLGSSLDCRILNRMVTGNCLKTERKDKSDVIFIEVKD